jgi:hypothetical protein
VHTAVGGKARRALARAGGAWDSRETTRRVDGAVPDCLRSRGEVYGEGTSKGAVGQLRERTPTRRPPGVRRLAGSVSTIEGGL